MKTMQEQILASDLAQPLEVLHPPTLPVHSSGY